MAIIAAGKTLGIAPNANLYLAKTKNMYKDSYFDDNGRTHMGSVQPKALDYVIQYIKRDVTRRLTANPAARSVVNMSWGKTARTTAGTFDLDEVLIPFIDFCDQLKIPVVISAGNTGQVHDLHSGTPQHLGRADSNIITVGAVKKDGTLWPGTAIPVPGQPGSMTVYAPGEVRT